MTTPSTSLYTSDDPQSITRITHHNSSKSSTSSRDAHSSKCSSTCVAATTSSACDVASTGVTHFRNARSLQPAHLNRSPHGQPAISKLRDSTRAPGRSEASNFGLSAALRNGLRNRKTTDACERSTSNRSVRSTRAREPADESSRSASAASASSCSTQTTCAPRLTASRATRPSPQPSSNTVSLELTPIHDKAAAAAACGVATQATSRGSARVGRYASSMLRQKTRGDGRFWGGAPGEAVDVATRARSEASPVARVARERPRVKSSQVKSLDLT
jgi:hypothetical protein